MRDEFRRDDSDLPRLVFADILVPHQGPAAQAVEVALRMLEAGVDAVGGAAPVQVVGGLSVAQAKRLAGAGLRAFVISGNLGEPDTRARYDLPPDQIERHVSAFIAAVSGA